VVNETKIALNPLKSSIETKTPIRFFKIS